MNAKGKNTLEGDGVRVQLVASALAQADEVVDFTDASELECLCCRRRVALSRIAINRRKPSSPTEAVEDWLVSGVCAECIGSASEERRAAVAELSQSAARAESLLSLIRHRAERELSGWWGLLGNAATGDLDHASVAVRRAIERLGSRT